MTYSFICPEHKCWCFQSLSYLMSLALYRLISDQTSLFFRAILTTRSVQFLCARIFSILQFHERFRFLGFNWKQIFFMCVNPDVTLDFILICVSSYSDLIGRKETKAKARPLHRNLCFKSDAYAVMFQQCSWWQCSAMMCSFTPRLFAFFSFSYFLAIIISLLFRANLVRTCGCLGIRVCLLLA